MGMKLRVHGFANLLEGINGGLEELKTTLAAQYQDAVETVSDKIADSAVQYLGKPTWLLSQHIADKTKVYKEGKFYFGVAEILNQKSPEKNTPGAYGWYQEHGYHVALESVRQPSERKTVRTLYRKRRFRAVYRRQEPRRFFEKSFATHQAEFFALIQKIHREMQIPIHPKKHWRDPY